ncbi:MAG: GTPase ObgE [Clostridiales bacterium]|jgi:GTP-binding protein|nr:GTPase ObgE [Clostridiales bacterium]
MFVDIINITIKGGDGGNGCVAFHRDAMTQKGGPSGGDGGNGGNVIIKVDTNMNTLMDFRYKGRYIAGRGEDGTKLKRSGKHGEDLVINVPLGTIIKDAKRGVVIADLAEAGAEFIASRGGNGGWGNTHFATPTRQTPNFAKAGQKVLEREIVLELKYIADLGLIGLPNVGKSTILSSVSNTKPKIANYEFTTLVPNLGIAKIDDDSITVADIPGLIEGAAEGLGLGHDFLRHVERTGVLAHVLDVSGFSGREPMDDFEVVNRELRKYSEILADKEQIVVLNKIDVTSEDMYAPIVSELEGRGYKVFAISAVAHKNIDAFLRYAVERIKATPKQETIVYEIVEEEIDRDAFTVSREGKMFVVEGIGIEMLAESTNFDDAESFAYFQHMLTKKGINKALIEAGVKTGDDVQIGECLLEYEE